MTKLVKLLALSFLSLLLISCVQTQEIEDINIINASGVDLLEDGDIEKTLVVFQFSSQTDKITQIITGNGKTLDGANEDAELASMNRIVPGKNKLMIFGEDLAKKGVLPYLDAQARDARVPDLMYLAIGRPTAKEILSVDEDEIAMDIGQYLHNLIENHSTDHNIPRKSLQDFFRIYYDIGQDNILPIFEIQEKTPKQIGIALFKGDQMVGELSNEEIILINLMDRVVKHKRFELTLPIEPFKDFLEIREEPYTKNELNIALFIQKGKSKTKIIDIDALKFETNTKMTVQLTEQSAGIELTKPEVVQTLEKEIEKKMEKDFNALLTKLKKQKSDPFGYGRYYKRTHEGKDLTVEEWREKYSAIQVTFNVDIELSSHGTID